MSQSTIKAIEDAIRAHVAEVDGVDPVMGDWFLAYSYMLADAETDDGISHHSGYTTSENSTPHGALGIATVGAKMVEHDVVVSAVHPDVGDDH